MEQHSPIRMILGTSVWPATPKTASGRVGNIEVTNLEADKLGPLGLNQVLCDPGIGHISTPCLNVIVSSEDYSTI